MTSEERVRAMLQYMLKYHAQIAERLKNIDLSILSQEQIEKLEEALKELNGYALIHVKTKKL